MFSCSLCCPFERDQEGRDVAIELLGYPAGAAGANYHWRSLGHQWIFGPKYMGYF